MSSLASIRNKKVKEEQIKNDRGRIDIVTLVAGDEQNFPKRGDTLCVHFTVALQDGSKVDNSYTRCQPILFTLGSEEIIKGWELVFFANFLSRGQKVQLTVPYDLAYGEQGIPPVIPAMANLVYEVELLSFSSPKK